MVAVPPSPAPPQRSAGHRPRRRGSRLRKAAVQLGVAVAVLAALEALLALLGVRAGTAGDDPFVGFSSQLPLFVEDAPGHRVTAPGKLRLFNEQSFAVPKAPGTVRIVTLGGSTTYGRPYDDRTSFSAWLREILNEADARGRRFEVLNAGGISYASYRVAVVLEEVLGYEPDAVVLYTGHNEFLEARTYPALAGASPALVELYALLGRSRLFGAARGLLRSDELPAEVETLLDASVGLDAYTRDDALREQVVRHFALNLERMVGAARDAGCRVVLVTPASALRDCLPFKSEPDGPATGGAAAGGDGPVDPAAAQAADPDGIAASLDERHALRLYHLGLAHLAAGHLEQARAALLRARDEDVCPLRAISPIVDAVRAVARERDVPLVDFVALLAERSPGGLPGADWFLDHVHPTIEGHRLLAVALAEELARQGLWDPAPGWREHALPRVAERIEARVDPELQGFALRNLAKVLGWAGKDAEAAALARRSQELLGQGDSETWFLLGTFARNAGRHAEAAEQFRNAVAIDPGYGEAWFDLGESLLAIGALDEAASAAARAAELMPAEPRAHVLVGLVAAQQRRPAQAEAAYRRALAAGGDSAMLRNNLGLAELRQGRADDARASFERAVALDPDYAKGHYNLGVLLAAQGERAAAEAHLETALRIAPDHREARDKLAELRRGGG